MIMARRITHLRNILRFLGFDRKNIKEKTKPLSRYLLLMLFVFIIGFYFSKRQKVEQTDSAANETIEIVDKQDEVSVSNSKKTSVIFWEIVIFITIAAVLTYLLATGQTGKNDIWLKVTKNNKIFQVSIRNFSKQGITLDPPILHFVNDNLKKKFRLRNTGENSSDNIIIPAGKKFLLNINIIIFLKNYPELESYKKIFFEIRSESINITSKKFKI